MADEDKRVLRGGGADRSELLGGGADRSELLGGGVQRGRLLGTGAPGLPEAKTFLPVPPEAAVEEAPVLDPIIAAARQAFIADAKTPAERTERENAFREDGTFIGAPELRDKFGETLRQVEAEQADADDQNLKDGLIADADMAEVRQQVQMLVGELDRANIQINVLQDSSKVAMDALTRATRAERLLTDAVQDGLIDYRYERELATLEIKKRAQAFNGRTLGTQAISGSPTKVDIDNSTGIKDAIYTHDTGTNPHLVTFQLTGRYLILGGITVGNPGSGTGLHVVDAAFYTDDGTPAQIATTSAHSVSTVEDTEEQYVGLCAIIEYDGTSAQSATNDLVDGELFMGVAVSVGAGNPTVNLAHLVIHRIE